MIKNNKIICIGDSTALPGHGNTYEDTWLFKLKKNFPNLDFVTVFRRSITTEILVNEGGGISLKQFPLGSDCLEFYNPRVVIVQLGIVDCAPRLLNSVDKLILKCLPNTFKRTYINFVKKIKKRKSTNTIVKVDKFESNFKLFIERCELNKVEALIFIAIPFPDYRMVTKNPEILLNIEIYNKVIRDLANAHTFIKVVNPLDSRNFSESIFEDGYHPNPLGNEIVFQKVQKFLTGIL